MAVPGVREDVEVRAGEGEEEALDHGGEAREVRAAAEQRGLGAPELPAAVPAPAAGVRVPPAAGRVRPVAAERQPELHRLPEVAHLLGFACFVGL